MLCVKENVKLHLLNEIYVLIKILIFKMLRLLLFKTLNPLKNGWST